MKRFAVLAAVLMLGAAGCDDDNTPPTTPSNPNTGPIVFTATLNTANEVPAITNTSEAAGTGTATMTMNVPRDASGNVTGAGTIDFSYTLANLPAGTIIRLAHIHPGRAGTAGPPLIDTGLTAATQVTLANGSTTAPITAPARAVGQADAINMANDPAGFYFNAHSALNPAGVVRGQLVRQ